LLLLGWKGVGSQCLKNLLDDKAMWRVSARQTPRLFRRVLVKFFNHLVLVKEQLCHFVISAPFGRGSESGSEPRLKGAVGMLIL